MRTALLYLCRALQVLGWVALLLWLSVFPLLWIVRDGLGPDSVETTGWAAVWKFSPVIFVALAILGFLLVLHFLTGRLRSASVGMARPEEQ